MLFRKNRKDEQLNTASSAVTVAELRRQLVRQTLMMTLCLTVAVFSVVAYLSRAWFANNKEVESTDSSIVSDTPSPSLFIRPAADTGDKQYANKTTRSDKVSLYPISTANLTDWFYASSFCFGEITSGGVTSSVPLADGFTKVEVFKDNNGTYVNSFEGNADKVAYYSAMDNLYTAFGTLDVYLDPNEPIKVSLNSADGGAAGKQKFLAAVRVGIKPANSEMVLIYAPVEESETGNTAGQSEAGFKAIAAAEDGTATWELVDMSDSVVTKDGLSTYQAEKSGDAENTYTAGEGKTKLCTADENGVDVTVYVWLEGTDADALINASDNDVTGISVSVSYVGVVPPTTGNEGE